MIDRDTYKFIFFNKLKNVINSKKYYIYENTYYNYILLKKNATRIDFDYKYQIMYNINIFCILIFFYDNKKKYKSSTFFNITIKER